MNSKIGDLSYGQEAKLMVLKMMLDRKNVLLLDEPTRNLSAISNPVVSEVLNDSNGCIIVHPIIGSFLKRFVMRCLG